MLFCARFAFFLLLWADLHLFCLSLCFAGSDHDEHQSRQTEGALWCERGGGGDCTPTCHTQPRMSQYGQGSPRLLAEPLASASLMKTEAAAKTRKKQPDLLLYDVVALPSALPYPRLFFHDAWQYTAEYHGNEHTQYVHLVCTGDCMVGVPHNITHTNETREEDAPTNSSIVEATEGGPTLV